jgi:hypothetical protein
VTAPIHWTPARIEPPSTYDLCIIERPLLARPRYSIPSSRRTAVHPELTYIAGTKRLSVFMRWDQAGLPKEERAPVRAVQKTVPEGFLLLLGFEHSEANTCVRRKFGAGSEGGLGRRRPGPRGPKPPVVGVYRAPLVGEMVGQTISWS